MTYRILGMLCALFLLCACSGVDDAMSYVGLGDAPDAATAFPGEETPVAAVTPAASAPDAPDAWCARVAIDEGQRAVQDGYDTATQRKMAAGAYKQCVMMSPAR